jgi:hypothetical protein
MRQRVCRSSSYSRRRARALIWSRCQPLRVSCAYGLRWSAHQSVRYRVLHHAHHLWRQQGAQVWRGRSQDDLLHVYLPLVTSSAALCGDDTLPNWQEAIKLSLGGIYCRSGPSRMGEMVSVRHDR